jgi:L-ribulokinase
MQLLADVTGRQVEIAGSPQVPARGSALFGAVAAGREQGGYAGIAEAVEACAPPPARTFVPDRRAGEVYNELFSVYRHLHDHLGREQPQWLHALKALRRRASAEGLA